MKKNLKFLVSTAIAALAFSAPQSTSAMENSKGQEDQGSQSSAPHHLAHQGNMACPVPSDDLHLMRSVQYLKEYDQRSYDKEESSVKIKELEYKMDRDPYNNLKGEHTCLHIRISTASAAMDSAARGALEEMNEILQQHQWQHPRMGEMELFFSK